MTTPRSEQDIQADVNVLLDTLLKTHDFMERSVAFRAPPAPGCPAPIIDFALDAVKRLRKDAVASTSTRDTVARLVEFHREVVAHRERPDQQTLNILSDLSEVLGD